MNLPPFVIYDPGADTAQNASRTQSVRAVTLHRTQGTNSRGVGKTRHHNTPGTFNFLIEPDGQTICFYPPEVRCSHAAGANRAGPGIEIEGFTGDPLSLPQVASLGLLADWLAGTYGVPLRYRTGDPRDWVDQSSYSGFIAHRGVDYPPDTSLRHFDEITPAEWATAVGIHPIPPPTQERGRQVHPYISIDGQTIYDYDTDLGLIWQVSQVDGNKVVSRVTSGTFTAIQAALALRQKVLAKASA